MTSHLEVRQDVGIGLAIALTIVAGIGGSLMIAGAADELAAVGFAIAVIAGLLAIWAVHTKE